MLLRFSWELGHKRVISIPNPTRRGSTLFVCLMATNIPNSTNLMAEVIQKQHIAHITETCNNAGTSGDLLVKQFLRTLKGIVFDWYTDLLPESINSWEQIEQEFLNRFYNAQCTVSMTELTNTK